MNPACTELVLAREGTAERPDRGSYVGLQPSYVGLQPSGSFGESDVTESEQEGEFFDCDDENRITAIKRHLWDRFKDEASPDVFGFHNLRIAPDAGLGDVHKLMYSSQYLYALIKVSGVIINCSVLVIQNMKVVFAIEDEDEETTEARSKFLVTAKFACSVLQCGDNSTAAEDRLHMLIPILEIVYMIFNMLAVVVCGICAIASYYCCDKSKWSLFTWSNTANLFLEFLPELVSFSALKILYYVTPIVITTQGYTLAVHAYERFNVDKAGAIWSLVWFVFSRLVMCLAGFDAFLIKFRIVSDYINQTDMDRRSLMVAILFIVQVLGAVKINYFTRERLYILIFGGQDGELNADEMQLVKVWEALTVRKIFETFGIFKGTIVMLGYDDYDFQTLVLDDDEVEMRELERKKSQEEDG